MYKIHSPDVNQKRKIYLSTERGVLHYILKSYDEGENLISKYENLSKVDSLASLPLFERVKVNSSREEWVFTFPFAGDYTEFDKFVFDDEETDTSRELEVKIQPLEYPTIDKYIVRSSITRFLMNVSARCEDYFLNGFGHPYSGWISFTRSQNFPILGLTSDQKEEWKTAFLNDVIFCYVVPLSIIRKREKSIFTNEEKVSLFEKKRELLNLLPYVKVIYPRIREKILNSQFFSDEIKKFSVNYEDYSLSLSLSESISLSLYYFLNSVEKEVKENIEKLFLMSVSIDNIKKYYSTIVNILIVYDSDKILAFFYFYYLIRACDITLELWGEVLFKKKDVFLFEKDFFVENEKLKEILSSFDLKEKSYLSSLSKYIPENYKEMILPFENIKFKDRIVFNEKFIRGVLYYSDDFTGIDVIPLPKKPKADSPLSIENKNIFKNIGCCEPVQTDSFVKIIKRLLADYYLS